MRSRQNFGGDRTVSETALRSLPEFCRDRTVSTETPQYPRKNLSLNFVLGLPKICNIFFVEIARFPRKPRNILAKICHSENVVSFFCRDRTQILSSENL